MITLDNIASASRKELVRAVRAFLSAPAPQSTKPAKPKPLSPRQAAWARPEVAEARTTRNRVRANGTEYRSTRAAFAALALPMAKHIGFRAQLKDHGRAVFDNGARKVRFELVD